MPNLRRATPEDAALIALQRHLMFADNGLATEARYAEMDLAFEPWVRTRLADGRYVGLFLEAAVGEALEQPAPLDQPAHLEPALVPAEKAAEKPAVLAAAGIFFADFPPHFLDPAPIRAYLLNFYTAPQARGRGFARQLLAACVEICRQNHIAVITLHASPFGKPIYEKFGFTQNNEMILRPTR
jgi:ribosomal protein S18 acetylase RimI-like enzyme